MQMRPLTLHTVGFGKGENVSSAASEWYERTKVREGLPQSVSMRLSKIIVNPVHDLRGDTDMRDLIQSLTDVGLLHPLLILPADDEGNHQLLSGYRRLRAARQLGWEEI